MRINAKYSEVMKCNVAIDTPKILIVQTIDIFNYNDGGWGIEDFTVVDHKLLRIRFATRSGQKKRANIASALIKCGISKTVSDYTLFGFRYVDVLTTGIGPKEIFTACNNDDPILVNVRNPLLTDQMSTCRTYKNKFYVFDWRRMRMPHKGVNIYKLVLVKVNNLNPVDLLYSVKRNIMDIVGSIAAPERCVIDTPPTHSVSCGGMLKIQ